MRCKKRNGIAYESLEEEAKETFQCYTEMFTWTCRVIHKQEERKCKEWTTTRRRVWMWLLLRIKRTQKVLQTPSYPVYITGWAGPARSRQPPMRSVAGPVVCNWERGTWRLFKYFLLFLKIRKLTVITAATAMPSRGTDARWRRRLRCWSRRIPCSKAFPDVPPTQCRIPSQRRVRVHLGGVNNPSNLACWKHDNDGNTCGTTVGNVTRQLLTKETKVAS